ncbi:MAG: carbon-nitrogen hydrolase family protein [Chloroflexi bacterium]|nr:carbon-nitrogen hydrolase family protein [Chloroflexota bacterium]
MKEKKVLGGREKVKVAVVQVAPVFMDKEKTIEKACKLIGEAGKNGAELIVFSEAFIPGYPAFYTGGFESKPSEWAPYMVALQDNSVVIGSQDTAILGEAAREADAYVVIGCNELDERPGSRTIYNSLLFIDRKGKVMGRHRKLMPTYTERTYWGSGDGSDLKVFDTDIGRIGGLICGENAMILTKAALMQQGEEFHIVVWPGAWRGHGQSHLLEPVTDSEEEGCLLHSIARAYAADSQAFVLSCSGILGPNDFPERWQHLRESHHTNYSYAVGGSVIVDPSGRYIAKPILGKETILYADCYAHHIKVAKAIFDCLGHYTRWDVVQIHVNTEPRNPEIKITEKPNLDLPISELRRISEEFEISMDKLEAIIEQISNSKSP